MSKKNHNRPDAFADLTWQDIESWAGPKALSRGRSYQSRGQVRELALTGGGDLIAWVEGSRRYAVKVSRTSGVLSSECTCPYTVSCKHAVAAVVEYIEMLKKGGVIPPAGPEDERLALIDRGGLDRISGSDGEEKPVTRGESPGCGKQGHPPDRAGKMVDFLKLKSKSELVRIITDCAARHPDIRQELEQESLVSSGSIAAAVSAVGRAIDRASAEPGWSDHWSDAHHTPDYSQVKSGLECLLAAGQADAVVSLGEKLFSQGIEQVGQSNDEGETGCAVAEAMVVVFQALAQCSLPDVDKLERSVDYHLRDEYELCAGLEQFWQRRFSRESWSTLADRLIERLKRLPDVDRDDTFTVVYRRDRLTDEIIRALENSGRGAEVLPLCAQEAEKTGSYVRLVERLRRARRTDEAEVWIKKGVAATGQKLPGVAARLWEHLLEIRRKQGSWSSAAAMTADRFFGQPSLAGFHELKKAAEKAGTWTDVRRAALHYLETGERPRPGDPAWPLPVPELAMGGGPARSLPHPAVRLEVALDERDTGDILRCYQVYSQKRHNAWGWVDFSLDDRAADALAAEHPDRSTAIWDSLAQQYIRLTNTSAYQDAAVHLRKMRRLMHSSGREDEWRKYLAALRTTHARKRKLLEVLDGLEGKPIIKS